LATETPPQPASTTSGSDGGPPRRPPYSIYDTRNLKRRRPRWVRIALWSLGSFLALVLVVAGVVGWWVHGLVNQVGNISQAVKSASGDLNQTLPTSGQPVTALVIGSDYRAGDGVAAKNNSRSDTLMLVRLDPQTKYISLLSLPRDLHVTIPAYHGQPSRVDKINSAYQEGGYKLAVKTVEAATNIKPNYLITVDFKGFKDLVNAFHGVYVPVDQRYYHVNTPGTEQYSQIDIPPGYQLLNGANGLAFSRYRHTDSDFYRNARQQVFLHAFSQRASAQLHGIGLDQINTFRHVADIVANNVQVTGPHGAPGIQTMIRLATTAYEIRNRVVSSRLNAVTAGDALDSYVVLGNPNAMKQAVFAFEHPESLGTPKTQLPSGGHKKHKFKPQVNPTTVPLTVVNGNGVTGSAAAGGKALQDWGYPVTVSQQPAPTFNFNQSAVYYRPSGKKAAQDVAAILGNAQTYPITAAYKAYGSGPLVVVLGKSFTGQLAHPSTKSGTPGGLPSDMQSDPSALRSTFATVNGPATFPVMYPTATQNASTFQSWITTPVRLYTINEAGGHNNSLYAYWQYNGIPGSYWGIEETRFVNAPILASPDQTRTLDGRKYMFYFNGSHIHMVAFIQNGTAYWVQNTLIDDMSNADMIAIARSLKPLR
jgi:LCP family protein required for cell wall assembly